MNKSNYRFLFFKTKRGFDEAFAKGDVDFNSIAFIREGGLIWTHGTYFLQTINIAGEETSITNLISGVSRFDLEQYVQQALLSYIKVKDLGGYVKLEDLLNYVKKTELPNLPDLIGYVREDQLKTVNNQSLIGEGNIEIEFPPIKNINGQSILGVGDILIYPGLDIHLKTVDGKSIVGDGNLEIDHPKIQLKTINNQSIEGEGNIDIQASITPTFKTINNLSIVGEGNIEITSQPTGPNHVFMTQSQYDLLEQYDSNTIYFILEDTSEWAFGGTFPITFGEPSQSNEQWQFGGTFPITLTEQWGFNNAFPITLT